MPTSSNYERKMNHSNILDSFLSYLDSCVNILPDLQPGLPAVVVRKDPETVAIPEWPVLEQTHLQEHLVQLGRDVLTPAAGSGVLTTCIIPMTWALLDSWLDQLESFLVNGNIGLPISERILITRLQKHSSLQSSVVSLVKKQ